MPEWLEKKLNLVLGRSALGRIESLIARKYDQIAQIEKIQFDDQISIQKRIDDLDTKIAGLRRERRRIEAELESAKNRNKQRIEQLRSELAELEANARALESPDIIGTPNGKTIEFRSIE